MQLGRPRRDYSLVGVISFLIFFALLATLSQWLHLFEPIRKDCKQITILDIEYTDDVSYFIAKRNLNETIEKIVMPKDFPRNYRGEACVRITVGEWTGVTKESVQINGKCRNK